MAEVRRFPVIGAGVGREDYAAPVLGPNAKEMRTERRSTTSNDSDIVDGQAPPNLRTGVAYEGKFYTRGCRGIIEQLQIYCIRTAAGRITLRYSPHPCLGPINTVIITPGAAWAWVGVDIEEMWNYDSLFIWVHACSVDVSWAFDAVLPLDGHESDDGGATWADLPTRPFIRAVYTGETGGDVPVSGIVNTIPIPSVATEVATGTVPNIANNTWTDICEADGAGSLLEARLNFSTSVAPTAGLAAVAAVTYAIRIFADGGLDYTMDNRLLCQSEVAIFGRNSVGEFYQATVVLPAYDVTRLSCRIPIQFRRNIRIQARQSTGGPVTVAGVIYTNEMR